MQLLIPWLSCAFARGNFLVAGVARNQDIPFQPLSQGFSLKKWVFACFTYSAFFNSPFCGCSNAWDQAFGIKCQAMITLGFLLFILVVLILTDCEQSAFTFLLCHSKRSGARVRGERRSPIISLFRSPSVVLRKEP